MKKNMKKVKINMKEVKINKKEVKINIKNMIKIKLKNLRLINQNNEKK